MKKERESLAVRVGERKSIAFATFFFACLGISAAFPYNIIISGTDWFHYILPDAENIAGSLASANFVASVVRFLLLRSLLDAFYVHPSTISIDTMYACNTPLTILHRSQRCVFLL